MQRVLNASTDIPGGQALLLAEQADTEAYDGHFKKAAELSQSAASLLQRDGNKEAAANCLAQAAFRDAEIGNSRQAMEFISQVQKMPRGHRADTLTALVMARTGNLKQAQILSQELDKQWPAGTFIQRYWLPVIRAEIHIQQSQPAKAVEDLVAAEPLEFATPPDLRVGTIYPAYLRGRAYLDAGDANRAIAEFQKITDHPGLVLNSPVAALARLELARAYSGAADREKARNAYRDLFAIWKDPDPDLPILVESKADYAKLH